MARHAVSLVGQRFGRLTVICRGDDYVSPNGERSIRWLCKCDCGNEKSVDPRSLKSGFTTSCGCFARERSRMNKGLLAKDIAGVKFGKLTAERPSGERRGSSLVWVCRCDCGAVCEATQHNLSLGIKKSCGCLTNFRTTRNEIYERVTGSKVPDECVVVFLDGNGTNQDAANMLCVNRAVNNKMHARGWHSPDAERTLTAIRVCELEHEIKLKEQS